MAQVVPQHYQPKFLFGADFNNKQLLKACFECLAAPPPTPALGRVYFDTAEDNAKIYTSAGWRIIGDYITAINVTAPIVAAVVNGVLSIAIDAATGSQHGYMSSQDKSKLDNSTANNTPSTLVQRDGTGNFAANVITASLNGNANTAGDADKLDGQHGSYYIGYTDQKFQDAKDYTDAVAQGLKPKRNARVAATTNIDIANPPAIIDGVTLEAGDLVFLKTQTDASKKGRYTYNGAGQPLTRAIDGNLADEIIGEYFFVYEGTFANWGFRLETKAPITLDATNLVYVDFSKPYDLNAAGGLEIVGGVVQIQDGGVTPAKLDRAYVENSQLLFKTGHLGSHRQTLNGVNLLQFVELYSGAAPTYSTAEGGLNFAAAANGVIRLKIPVLPNKQYKLRIRAHRTGALAQMFLGTHQLDASQTYITESYNFFAATNVDSVSTDYTSPAVTVGSTCRFIDLRYNIEAGIVIEELTIEDVSPGLRILTDSEITAAQKGTLAAGNVGSQMAALEKRTATYTFPADVNQLALNNGRIAVLGKTAQSTTNSGFPIRISVQIYEAGLVIWLGIFEVAPGAAYGNLTDAIKLICKPFQSISGTEPKYELCYHWVGTEAVIFLRRNDAQSAGYTLSLSYTVFDPSGTWTDISTYEASNHSYAVAPNAVSKFDPDVLRAEFQALNAAMDTRVDALESNITTTAKAYPFTITGDGVSTSFAVIHGLNLSSKFSFTYTLFEVSTNLPVGIIPQADSVNQCTFDFGEAVANGKEYKGVIVGR